MLALPNSLALGTDTPSSPPPPLREWKPPEKRWGVRKGRTRFLAKIPKVLRKLFFQSFGYYRFDYWVTGNLEFEICNVGVRFIEPEMALC